MQDMVRRLIDCGMSRAVALCVLRQIRDPIERELYVEQVEAENREPMEIL